MHWFQLVIGLVGYPAAGKDTFCEYLANPQMYGGFDVYAISDSIREETKKRGMENPTRTEMQKVANEYRQKFGYAYWASRTLAKAKTQHCSKLVINGIRNPAEIDSLEKMIGQQFVLVGITAPTMLRYERAKARARKGDAPNLETFLAMDDSDRGIGQAEDGQQVDRCLARIPVANVFNNAGSVEEMQAWADNFIKVSWLKSVECV